MKLRVALHASAIVAAWLLDDRYELGGRFAVLVVLICTGDLLLLRERR